MVRDFLLDILPDAHFYAAALLTNNMRHLWFNSREAFAEWVERSQLTVDAYLAFAGFRERSRRKASAEALKTFVLDVDIGKEGGYQSKRDAARALAEHVKVQRLPTPTWIVDSGGGLHLYWVLTQSVPVHEWVQVAEGFKAALKQADPMLAVDVARVADPAGLLRLPGSFNMKYDPPRPVKIKKRLPVRYEFEQFKAAYGGLAAKAAPSHLTPATGLPMVSDVDEAALNRTPVTSQDLLAACPAFAFAKQRAAQADYNEWWATVQLCAFLEDGAGFVHTLSSPHPDYNPADTATKFDQARHSRAEGVGPVTCMKLTEAMGTNAPCAQCRYRQRVKSPIVAARRLRRHIELEEARQRAENADEEDTFQRAQAALRLLSDAFGQELFLNERGGVSFRVEAENGGELSSIEVFPRLVIPTGLMRDHEGLHILVDVFSRDCRRIETHTKLSALQVGATANHHKAASLLGAVLPAGSKAEAHAKRFIGALALIANHLENREYVHQTMGPASDGFLYGSKLLRLRPDGTLQVKDAFVGDSVKALDKHFGTRSGSEKAQLDALRELIPDMKDVAQYYMLASLASPLLHIADVSGAVVHLWGVTGYGKTTIGRIALSFFGKPADSIISSRDTVNAAEAKLKALHVFPAIYDEFTPELMGVGAMQSVVNMLYSVTNGHGRDRATRTGELRQLDGRWQLIMMTTSNSAIADVIGKNDASAVREALRQRVIELKTGDEGDFFLHNPSDHMYDVTETVTSNYGHLGWLFVEKMLRDADAIRDEVTEMVRELNREHGIASRFVNATHACIKVAGRMLNDILGEELIDMTLIDELRKKLGAQTEEDRTHIEEIDDPVGILVDAISLTGRSAMFKYNNGELEYIGAPMDNVDVRIEKHGRTVEIWFARTAFDRHVTAAGATPSSLLDTLQARRLLVPRPDGRRLCMKELTAGVPDKSGIIRARPPSRCYYFVLPADELGL